VSLWDKMVDAVKRLSCIQVCETCVRRYEEVVSKSFFGDYALCERCHTPMMAHNQAFWVKP